MSLKFTNLRLQSNPPGANELKVPSTEILKPLHTASEILVNFVTINGMSPILNQCWLHACD